VLASPRRKSHAEGFSEEYVFARVNAIVFTRVNDLELFEGQAWEIAVI